MSQRPASTMFLSGAWLQASLDTWGDAARYALVELAHDGLPAVWAILGRRTELRHGLLPVRVVALNESAVESFDQPWIEQNGFFGAAPGLFPLHLSRLIEHLAADPGWDEMRLSGLADGQATEALYTAARAGLACRIAFEQPSFQVDLEAVRTRHGGDYLSALGANTRQQLRRSRRHAEGTLGPLRLEVAASSAQALAWFDATAPLHRARWGDCGEGPFGSGFDNPRFVAFHRRFIELAFPAGGIQYVRLSAGDRPLAYLYNLVAGDSVQFYLSGIDYGVDERVRPGLLAHWLAIEHNLAASRAVYDFLAGDARYKRSLSTRGGRTVWLVLQRPRWRLQFETFARRLRRSLRPAGDGPPRSGHRHLPAPARTTGR